MRHILSMLSLSIITFHIHNYFGAFMKLVQGTLAIALSTLLVACGGGGSSGYYDNNNTGGNTGGGTTQPPAVDLVAAKAQLDVLKREGQYLFGNYDPNDATTTKGYIDHALDTFAQGPLQLSQDIRKVDVTQYPNNYRPKCFNESTSDYRACYIFVGEEIKTLVSGYNDWDFDITASDLKGINLQHDEVSPNLEDYQAPTMIFVFENENADKNFHDVTISGAFAYPFQQSWGLEQTKQKRFVLINQETSDYKITFTLSEIDSETGEATEREVTTGAISIHKDLTSKDGELFKIRAGSGFNVLVNDNPNVSFAEPVSLRIESTPGNAETSASLRIKDSGEQELNLPSVTTIDGTRVENETPNLNAQQFTGSIFLSGNNIFTFKQNVVNSTLNFKHTFNGFSYEGKSVNDGKKITTTLTQPSGLSY